MVPSSFTKARIRSVIYHYQQLYVVLGYYTDAILKFRLTFPRNFPEQPPSVHFVTDVFHPLVSQKDGFFNLAPRFHSWRYGAFS